MCFYLCIGVVFVPFTEMFVCYLVCVCESTMLRECGEVPKVCLIHCFACVYLCVCEFSEFMCV